MCIHMYVYVCIHTCMCTYTCVCMYVLYWFPHNYQSSGSNPGAGSASNFQVSLIVHCWSLIVNRWSLTVNGNGELVYFVLNWGTGIWCSNVLKHVNETHSRLHNVIHLQRQHTLDTHTHTHTKHTLSTPHTHMHVVDLLWWRTKINSRDTIFPTKVTH